MTILTEKQGKYKRKIQLEDLYHRKSKYEVLDSALDGYAALFVR
ncbi:hypothetical protein [Leptospira sp. 85282-16]|nr:hypothetical protein [Leptospira sp. 85282-16]